MLRFFFLALGVVLLLGAWETGHRLYGELVLPGVFETAQMFVHMVGEGRVWPALVLTAGNASSGWIVGVGVGLVAGGFAGLREGVRLTLQPIFIIFLGIPAIAWIVLALLWFGGHWAVVFTVAVATGPIIYGATVQGVRSLDRDLASMARAFRAPLSAMVLDVYGPHLLNHLFPALAATLAMSWKVSVMAELLTGSGGIGDGLATARARVDSAEIMAWIVVVVCVLVLVDRLMLNPLQRRLEMWRDDDGKVTMS
ncbi:ABC transporter permease [Cohaesibacter celericrescens]|uniref:ABC transporter permease n=1 Tax=Cohaesibacter celericrescens TaxID=2067669 RepID=A0A2N5XQ44_9HYPH|nr:ABC transporter permease subunit [Cohaesibacter celericrescens]PLW76550.1 ABC transporter permease [Cohaesibacter celericrescens]